MDGGGVSSCAFWSFDLKLKYQRWALFFMSNPTQLTGLQALDVWVFKLKAFVAKSLHEIGANEEFLEATLKKMEYDPILYVPVIKDMIEDLKKFEETGKKVSFFSLLLPDNMKNVSIPEEIHNKGVQFLQVFTNILKDIDG